MIWRGAGGAVRGGSSDRVAASTGAGSREDIAALLERHQSARAGSAGQGRSGRGRGQKISIENILSFPGRRATRAASGRCGRGSPPSCRCPRRWRPPCPRSLSCCRVPLFLFMSHLLSFVICYLSYNDISLASCSCHDQCL